jgi:CRISPR system Cascade subunit CasB
MLYLVAGLWAMHWREGSREATIPIGKACAFHQVASGSTSAENRFITLLDSDGDQLPHRLRQMVALLKDYSIDFTSLLRDLINWNDDRKRTQQSWARDFYRNLHQESEESNSIEEEGNA